MFADQFKPSSELTFDTVQSDRNRLLSCLKNDKLTGIEFDLSQVKHCDSAGLALLIETKRLCNQYNKSFEIKGMPKSIHALAEFCGVQSMFNMSKIDD